MGFKTGGFLTGAAFFFGAAGFLVEAFFVAGAVSSATITVLRFFGACSFSSTTSNLSASSLTSSTSIAALRFFVGAGGATSILDAVAINHISNTQ
jgi:hypothetical protein